MRRLFARKGILGLSQGYRVSSEFPAFGLQVQNLGLLMDTCNYGVLFLYSKLHMGVASNSEPADSILKHPKLQIWGL